METATPPLSSPTRSPLTERQLVTLAAVAAAIFPHGGAFPLGAADVNVAHRLNEYLRAFDPRTQRQIRLLLTAWEYATVPSRYARTFSRLATHEQAEVVAAAAHSRNPLRHLPLTVLKQLCGLTFGAAPEVEAAFDFTHACLRHEPAQSAAPLHPLMFPDIAGNVTVTTDACVIGSGAGGAVVAKELASAGLSVVVIEEGGYFTAEDFSGPPFERIVRCYRDQGATMAWGRPPIPLPLGQAVGGTTVINSGSCFRTPDTVLRHWESAFGIDGIDPAAMAPLFDRVEHALGVRPVPWELIGRNAELFDRGVKALGLRGEPMRRNIRGCRGCGACAFGCPSNAKQAVHVTYLPEAERCGAQIYARCRAERILVEKGRAVGVVAQILDPHSAQSRGCLHVRAPIVIVAAGAVHTPGLLRANNIGHRSRQLGHNLRIHPAVAVTATFTEPVHAWRGTLQSYFVDHLMDSDDVMIEVTNPIPGLGVASGSAVGTEAKTAMAGSVHLAAAGLFVADTGAGRVVQLGRRRTPIIFYNLHRDDARKLARGIALVAEIFLAAGARSVQSGIRGYRDLTTPADLVALRDGVGVSPAALTPSAFHPMGTCRMGRNPATSVIDPLGESHDIRNLYVADASIFPTCVGVNPQVSIMAFATRIAAAIARPNGE